MTKRNRQGIVLAGLVGTLLLAPAPINAIAADYFAGKTINLIAGTDVGGGFSIYARVIGKHLGRHIPGNPAIIVRNMPGAGGATSATYLYRIAPRDGTTILSVSPNAILAKLMDDTQTQYDPAKFHYLAGAERGVRLCMTFRHSKVKTFGDALTQRAVIGATSAGSPTREYAAMIKHATGAKFEIVSGYRGPPELFIAMERGEIDGTCGLDWSALKAQQPDWLRDKKLNILVQFATQRDRAMPDVPTVLELTSDLQAREVFRFLVATDEIGRSLFTTPNVPPARLALLRSAFEKMLVDPEFHAEAEGLKLPLAPKSGEDMQRVVAEVFNVTPAAMTKIKEVTRP